MIKKNPCGKNPAANSNKNKYVTHSYKCGLGDCCTIEHCQKDDEPVCDNRGGTHASECHFLNTKCIHEKIHPNSTLLLAYKGACCDNRCDGSWAPVCDQHGTVYKNKCLFQLRECEYDKRYLEHKNKSKMNFFV